MKVISSEEMGRLDRESPVEAAALMERAGKGMAEFIRDCLPGFPVVFLCGAGNNGGDGIVAASYLRQWGRQEQVYLLSDKKLKGLPALQAKNYPGKINILKNMEELKFILSGKAITVDCILGTGFTPPLRQNVRDILEIVNKNSKITLSCDIPTGVNASDGRADEVSAQADVTVTFEFPKTGHILPPGSDYSGSVELVKIGTGIKPQEYNREFEMICRDDCRDYFIRRKKRSHKKDFGHVLAVGGSPGMECSVAMAAAGALKSGAGLVSCAVSGQVWNRISNISMSSMAVLLDGFESDNIHKIIDFAAGRNIDSALIGPGMGTSPDALPLTDGLIKQLNCPLVLDADALNCIAASGPEILDKRKGRITLLTPHPGEMSRLCGKNKKIIAEKGIEIAVEFARKYSVIVLLKGYRSVVTDGKSVFINSTGGPGMAVGGSGDILSGMAGALLAQGFSGIEAAKTAAWVHGRAGDLAIWKKGERSAQPEDFLAEMGRV